MAKDKDTQESQKNVTIDDFIIKQGVKAFISAYQPSSESMATDVFNISRLRDFFQAWPNSLGDPLIIYIDSLEAAGFSLTASSGGTLAIFVTDKEMSSVTL